MTLLDRLRGFFQTTVDVLSPAAFIRGLDFSDFGRRVTTENADKIEGIYTSVKILGEGLGTLPMEVQEGHGPTRKRVESHWFSEVFANPGLGLTSQELVERAVHGCGIAGRSPFVKITERGQTVQLIALPDPYLLKPKVVKGKGGRFETVYEYGDETFLPSDLWIPSNIWGLSPIKVLATQLGLTQAYEEHATSVLNNAVRPSGTLTHPGKLSPDAKEAMREGWREKLQGLGNAGGLIILSEGMTFNPITLDNVDLQFIEQAVMTRRLILGAYRIPLHMAGDLERATFSNIEHLGIDFVRFTLLPWVRRLELSIKRDLLSGPGDENIFVRFNVDGLQRGDYKARTEGNAKALLSGQLRINEARALEDRPPDEDGDVLLVPANMRTLKSLMEDPEPVAPVSPGLDPFGSNGDEDGLPGEQLGEDMTDEEVNPSEG